MKNVLVTGGLGFIGSHTCVSLIENGYTPIVIDNLHNSTISVKARIEKIAGCTIAFYQGDVRNIDFLKIVFENHTIDAVIHFAALKAVNESLQIPLEYLDVNIGGLISLLKCMTLHNVKNIVFSSSCTVYGQPDFVPVSEIAPFLPAQSTYGLSKQMGEQILQANTNINTVSLRYFNPVGAHPSSLIGELPNGTPSNLFPFITQTAAGIREKLQVFGSDYNTLDGTAIRDYIHVCDLADAHIYALKTLQNNNSKDNYSVYNIGTGTGISVMEIINCFETTNKVKINWEFAPRRAGDIEKVWANTMLSEKKLGWKTKKTITDMVKDAWNWQLTLNTQQ